MNVLLRGLSQFLREEALSREQYARGFFVQRNGGTNMREWQQTRDSAYVMPYAVYYQSIWAVRDLARMEEKLKEIKGDPLDIDTRSYYNCVGKEPHRNSSPTENRAVEEMILESRIEAIRKALTVLPDDLREPVLLNVAEKVDCNYPDRMWKQWKQRFLYNVAKNLSLM